VLRHLLSFLGALLGTLAILTVSVAFAFFVSLLVGYHNLVFGFAFLLYMAVILGGSAFLVFVATRSLFKRLFPA
jgi:hypothetical protein